jgi:hypothetical protein
MCFFFFQNINSILIYQAIFDLSLFEITFKETVAGSNPAGGTGKLIE